MAGEEATLQVRREGQGEAARAALADAVHRVVTEHTATDGLGKCAIYAILGTLVARRVFGRDYRVQAGVLYLSYDPKHPFQVLACDHCWFVRDEEGRIVEVADLSSRHYARMVTDLSLARGAIRPAGARWNRESPPEYLWANGTDAPPAWVSWACFRPDPGACRMLTRECSDNREEYGALAGRVLERMEGRPGRGP